MPDRKFAYFYRATCFGSPVGPWRDSMRDARRDLIQLRLGSYDEHGTFYITVPGGMQRDGTWLDYSQLPCRGRAA